MIWLFQVLKLKKYVALIRFTKWVVEEICFFLRLRSHVFFFNENSEDMDRFSRKILLSRAKLL